MLNSISAELFIATGCSHCPLVLNELSDLLKKGQLASLNITNIAVTQQRASELNIRSVPWFSLSNQDSNIKFSGIFSGNHSPAEIKNWVKSAQSDKGMQEYIESNLADGQLDLITQAIELVPETFSVVITMLEDEETSMHIRIGLDALLENFSASEILKNYTTSLKTLATKDNIRLQIDALHYLALTADPEIKTFLQEKTQDPDIQIKDAAIEALETLHDLIN